ncbi:MAG: adenylyltransferase/cytidyltransferase family protein [Elusimicrobia bacterium]|nr:adenylyltransferase/cytidyltransferase family protein [Elusimicrobiota bacterium]
MTARKIETVHKVMLGGRLPAWRRALTRAKKTLVFTNGVFDILHAGHVSVLERARSLGSALIVGVNSDASVRRLGKGPERPLNPLRDRMRVLAGLACVDAVTPFSEDTPERLLSRLRPDILVKGGDYRADAVAGRSHAGKVVILPLVKGRSTTALVKKLRA